jgi:hypothetical protein
MNCRAVLMGAATVIVVLWIGCGGDEQLRVAVPAPTVSAIQPAGRVPGPLPPDDRLLPRFERCQRDDECRSGFCEEGICANFQMYGFGDECDPDRWYSPPPRGAPGGVIDYCLGYLCVDRRCRSCESDEECRDKFAGRNTCASSYRHAGYTCDSTPILPEAAAQVTPVPVRPAVNAPAGGFPHRSVAAGGACVRDGDCRSLFCDRGVCTELYGPGNYGHTCDPAEYQGTLEQIRKRASEPDGCGGHICRQDRCRSCQSDADCAHAVPPKCIVQAGYRVRVCAGMLPEIPTRPPRPPPGLATPPPDTHPPPPVAIPPAQ